MGRGRVGAQAVTGALELWVPCCALGSSLVADAGSSQRCCPLISSLGPVTWVVPGKAPSWGRERGYLPW